MPPPPPPPPHRRRPPPPSKNNKAGASAQAPVNVVRSQLYSRWSLMSNYFYSFKGQVCRRAAWAGVEARRRAARALQRNAKSTRATHTHTTQNTTQAKDIPVGQPSFADVNMAELNNNSALTQVGRRQGCFCIVLLLPCVSFFLSRCLSHPPHTTRS